jgi:putative two-component system response regulator
MNGPFRQLESDAKVLIVDDDPMNLTILREVLDGRFGPIVEARNGAEAVEAVKRDQPALALMDIMMPEMDGYQACRLIKQSDWGASTHVILLSAKASTAERVQGYDAGADDYLTKPFDEEELLAKARVQLRLRQALRELAEARAATAADNVKLEAVVEQRTGQLLEMRDLLVFALAKLADSRDPETGEHLERIREYSRVLADQLRRHGPYRDDIDDDFVRSIYRSSPLHDIGKVGIPDVVLLKPGRLTDREFEMMKQHAMIGADALGEVARHGKTSGRFLNMAIDIARHHHERFDGSGYPDKLSGHSIPLAARIVALADVFDALTSIRVYKAAFTIEVARSMIEAESGNHFDPAVVEAFKARFDDFARIRREHKGRTEAAGKVGQPTDHAA